MSARELAFADNPKAALDQFLSDLIEKYYPWYRRSVTLHYWLSVPIQIFALLSGFGTSILAALVTDQTFKSISFIRVLLILLPALGAAAATVAVQSKLYDRYELREKGRHAIQSLYNEGRMRYAAATSSQDYTDIHIDLVKRVDQIEAEQSARFFSLTAMRRD
jgi:hypothetical protein